MTGGGIYMHYRGFDGKSGFEEAHPSGDNFYCDHGFGSGDHTCYLRACRMPTGATCTTYVSDC